MQISFLIIFLIICCKEIQIKGFSPWPSGSYGLPRPQTGCPQYWKDGYRYQDTEDEHSNNKHSISYHLSGLTTKHGIRQEFCMKEESLFEDADVKWPDGKYCIYKAKDECPDGLKEGWIFWDDENIEELDGGNSIYGHTPDGVYEKDTLLYFCCNDKGNVSIPIELPLNIPFYLFPYGSRKCQQVIGSPVISEYIHWDDEDRGNRNAHSKYVPYGVELDPWDNLLYYCYYNAGICGKHGTMCRNVSIDENKLEGKSAVMQIKHRPSKKWKGLQKEQKASSLTAVIVGCSIAGMILGTGFAGLVIRHVLNKRLGDSYEGDIDESLPLPDHEW